MDIEREAVDNRYRWPASDGSSQVFLRDIVMIGDMSRIRLTAAP
jgi:hypothetical protein